MDINITIPKKEVSKVKDFADVNFGSEYSDLMVNHYDLGDNTFLYRSQVDATVDYSVNNDDPVVVQFDVINGLPNFSGWVGRILATVAQGDNGSVYIKNINLG